MALSERFHPRIRRLSCLLKSLLKPGAGDSGSRVTSQRAQGDWLTRCCSGLVPYRRLPWNEWLKDAGLAVSLADEEVVPSAVRLVERLLRSYGSMEQRHAAVQLSAAERALLERDSLKGQQAVALSVICDLIVIVTKVALLVEGFHDGKRGGNATVRAICTLADQLRTPTTLRVLADAIRWVTEPSWALLEVDPRPAAAAAAASSGRSGGGCSPLVGAGAAPATKAQPPSPSPSPRHAGGGAPAVGSNLEAADAAGMVSGLLCSASRILRAAIMSMGPPTYISAHKAQVWLRLFPDLYGSGLLEVLCSAVLCIDTGSMAATASANTAVAAATAAATAAPVGPAGLYDSVYSECGEACEFLLESIRTLALAALGLRGTCSHAITQFAEPMLTSPAVRRLRWTALETLSASADGTATTAGPHPTTGTPPLAATDSGTVSRGVWRSLSWRHTLALSAFITPVAHHTDMLQSTDDRVSAAAARALLADCGDTPPTQVAETMAGCCRVVVAEFEAELWRLQQRAAATVAVGNADVGGGVHRSRWLTWVISALNCLVPMTSATNLLASGGGAGAEGGGGEAAARTADLAVLEACAWVLRAHAALDNQDLVALASGGRSVPDPGEVASFLTQILSKPRWARLSPETEAACAQRLLPTGLLASLDCLLRRQAEAEAAAAGAARVAAGTATVEGTRGMLLFTRLFDATGFVLASLLRPLLEAHFQAAGRQLGLCDGQRVTQPPRPLPETPGEAVLPAATALKDRTLQDRTQASGGCDGACSYMADGGSSGSGRDGSDGRSSVSGDGRSSFSGDGAGCRHGSLRGRCEVGAGSQFDCQLGLLVTLAKLARREASRLEEVLSEAGTPAVMSRSLLRGYMLVRCGSAACGMKESAPPMLASRTFASNRTAGTDAASHLVAVAAAVRPLAAAVEGEEEAGAGDGAAAAADACRGVLQEASAVLLHATLPLLELMLSDRAALVALTTNIRPLLFPDGLGLMDYATRALLEECVLRAAHGLTAATRVLPAGELLALRPQRLLAAMARRMVNCSQARPELDFPASGANRGGAGGSGAGSGSSMGGGGSGPGSGRSPIPVSRSRTLAAAMIMEALAALAADEQLVGVVAGWLQPIAAAAEAAADDQRPGRGRQQTEDDNDRLNMPVLLEALNRWSPGSALLLREMQRVVVYEEASARGGEQHTAQQESSRLLQWARCFGASPGSGLRPNWGYLERTPCQPQWPPRRLRLCGNPGCVNLGGPAEAALKLRLCAGCRVVRYCSAECQRRHWVGAGPGEGHRAQCARLRAEAAEAEAGGGSDGPARQ